MSENLIIRSAVALDLSDLMELYAQLHPGAQNLAPTKAAQILEEFSRYPGSAVFVGHLGRKLASTCALVVIPNLTRNGAPYALIENVITEATLRGRGFARQVLDHAISEAWQQDCYKVMLMTGSKNPATLRFYANAGFEQSKTGFQIRRVPERAPGV